MNRTVLCPLAILSLWLSPCTQSVSAAPPMAQAVDGSKAIQRSPGISIHHLFQHWVHSSQEEPPGSTVQVFRPAGSRAFPPSRFRMAYKFAPNGDCEFYFLSPDDGHRFKPCSWAMGPSNKMILQISENGTTTSFRIVQLTARILRLAPLSRRETNEQRSISRLQAPLKEKPTIWNMANACGNNVCW